MNIIYKSREFTPREQYKMTRNADIEKLSEHNGEVICITGAILFEDEKEDGSVETILSLELDSGIIIATNSATVRRSFSAIDACYNHTYPIPDVIIKSGESKKGGRQYYDIALI